jgi:soluble lytic murein transglycosylase
LEELDRRGFFLEAKEIAQSYIIENSDASVEFWKLNYPRPYQEIVAAAAETYSIDPLLIWAVMRVESSYETDALSLAGARGLLQLMPSTQEWISEQLKQETQPGDAYVPEENINMGAWFLSYLLDYFEGDLDLAIMAYNAGAASVEEWQADPMVNDRDDLIRWVWYGESREYLQRVSLAYSIYQELYE